MPDKEMIERCSNALDEKDFNLNALERDQIVLIVIKAMREPTEKMLSIDAPDMPAGGDIKEIWQDMIDAVIDERD